MGTRLSQRALVYVWNVWIVRNLLFIKKSFYGFVVLKL